MPHKKLTTKNQQPTTNNQIPLSFPADIDAGGAHWNRSKLSRKLCPAMIADIEDPFITDAECKAQQELFKRKNQSKKCDFFHCSWKSI